MKERYVITKQTAKKFLLLFVRIVNCDTIRIHLMKSGYIAFVHEKDFFC